MDGVGDSAASLLAAFFASLGLPITVEESSNAGRLEMAMRCGGRALISEFKLVDDEATPGGNSALAAIEERGHAERYRAEGVPADCVGIEFSRQHRRVVAWDTRWGAKLRKGILRALVIAFRLTVAGGGRRFCLLRLNLNLIGK